MSCTAGFLYRFARTAAKEATQNGSINLRLLQNKVVRLLGSLKKSDLVFAEEAMVESKKKHKKHYGEVKLLTEMVISFHR
jgi:hypothetical protein